MTTMTGKQAVMEMLMAEGVKYIFGNPGTSEGPILDALEDYPDFQYFQVWFGVYFDPSEVFVGWLTSRYLQAKW